MSVGDKMKKKKGHNHGPYQMNCGKKSKSISRKNSEIRTGITRKRRCKDGQASPAQQVLEGIFYVLRIGCQWKAVPREYGCGSSIHRYFQEWQVAGFFEKI